MGGGRGAVHSLRLVFTYDRVRVDCANDCLTYSIQSSENYPIPTKFFDFRILEKILRINTREKKRAQKLKSQNLIPYEIRKQYINYKCCESQSCW